MGCKELTSNTRTYKHYINEIDLMKKINIRLCPWITLLLIFHVSIKQKIITDNKILILSKATLFLSGGLLVQTKTSMIQKCFIGLEPLPFNNCVLI